MKVNEFIEIIKDTNREMPNIINDNAYMPILVKKSMMQEVVYESSNDDDGYFHVDSVTRYLSFVRHIINAYTQLEYTDDDYDSLCKTVINDKTALDYIMAQIEPELRECSRILEMVIADKEREYSIETTFARLANDVSVKADGIVQTITNKIGAVDSQNLIPNDIDLDQLKSFLENYKGK